MVEDLRWSRCVYRWESMLGFIAEPFSTGMTAGGAPIRFVTQVIDGDVEQIIQALRRGPST
ncbi:hypothetical protein BJF87_19870 [Gordonia sp. CNJ-863]|nr:hypothetical protein A9310_11585 [Gordonia sp. UCD-TK1]OLT48689.1 hypothetical protein BJF87_19870 [Gordonia sp. CNJ-863]